MAGSYPYDDEAQRLFVYRLANHIGDGYTIDQFEDDVWDLLHRRSLYVWSCEQHGHVYLEGSWGCVECGDAPHSGSPDHLAGLDWAGVPNG